MISVFFPPDRWDDGGCIVLGWLGKNPKETKAKTEMTQLNERQEKFKIDVIKVVRIKTDNSILM